MDDKIIPDLEKKLGIQEKQDILKFRNEWSPRIWKLIAGILIFQGCFVVAIGFGLLDYSQYTSVISVYLGESVIQVFGLGVIVLKFLFANNKK